MNPKAETVEELLARRKGLHMGMLKLAREDLALTLQAAIDAYAVLQQSRTAMLQKAAFQGSIALSGVSRVTCIQPFLTGCHGPPHPAPPREASTK